MQTAPARARGASQRAARRSRLRPLPVLLVALALLTAACAGRPVTESVYDTGGVEVALRGPADPAAAERTCDHPVVISAPRLARILAALEVRIGEERRAAVPSDVLHPIAEGLSRALRQAEPHQEAVVKAVHRERRFGLFTHEYFTGLLACEKDDLLHVLVSHAGLQLARGPDREVPEPSRDRRALGLRVLPAESVRVTGSQSVAARWRDERFGSSGMAVTPDGRVQRRTILMEGGSGAAGAGGGRGAPGSETPDGLSPETLRDLADLEEARRRGELTEAEYRARREEILSGTP